MERLPDGHIVPSAYPKFDLLPIAGLWRPGGSKKRLVRHRTRPIVFFRLTNGGWLRPSDEKRVDQLR